MRRFLKVALAFSKAACVAAATQRRVEAERLKAEIARRKILQEDAKIAAENNKVVLLDMQIETVRETMETAIATPHNKALIQELEIELKKLKILELERKLGTRLPPFDAENYESD